MDLEFRPFAAIGNPNALVCLGSNLKAGDPEDPRCGTGVNRYNGPEILAYTAETDNNQLSIQARLVPRPVGNIPQFVIGDCEWAQWKPKSAPGAGENNLRELDDEVNFWGAQWWKNNCMSLFVSNGYPAFKGFATNVITTGNNNDCGSWQARPGNSGHPPATLPDVIDIIVTDNVVKNGPNISGHIKQIVRVDRTQSANDNYAGNPGHQGWGRITNLVCGAGAPAPAP